MLLVGLLRGAFARERVVPLLTLATLAASIGFEIARFHHPASIISGALRIDDLALMLDMIFCVAAIACVILSLPSRGAGSAGHGEYHSLLLFSVLGMAVLVSAQNLVTLFVGFELLSIPLYVLCASEFRREGSLESGLKYLVIGSVGSATLVYGLALIYGATGATQFQTIANAISQGQIAGGLLGDPLLLTGLGLVMVGFAFKASRGAVPPVDARRLRGRADADHRVHGDRHQGGGVRRPAAVLRRRRDRRPGHVGAGAGDDRRDHDHRRQRRRARAVLAEADARLLERRARPATCSPASSSAPGSESMRPCST